MARVNREFKIPVATHLTCVGRTVDELRQYLCSARELNVENVVALRGDPPRGDSAFRPVEGGFRYANELVGLIHGEFPDFGIAVAGYPEKHQEAPSHEVDLANLKRKVDAGADVVITQLFLQQRRLLSLSRSLPGARHSVTNRSRTAAGYELCPNQENYVAVRGAAACGRLSVSWKPRATWWMSNSKSASISPRDKRRN